MTTPEDKLVFWCRELPPTENNLAKSTWCDNGKVIASDLWYIEKNRIWTLPYLGEKYLVFVSLVSGARYQTDKDGRIYADKFHVDSYMSLSEYFKQKTNKEIMTILSQCGMVISQVRDPSIEACITAVKQDAHALSGVPEEMMRGRVLLEAVRAHSIALMHVPFYLRTLELCMEAVSKDGGALEYVPDELKTLEVCNIAMSSKLYFGAFKNVPEEFKTLKMCVFAVRRTLYEINYVSPEMQPLVCSELGINMEFARKWMLDPSC